MNAPHTFQAWQLSEINSDIEASAIGLAPGEWPQVLSMVDAKGATVKTFRIHAPYVRDGEVLYMSYIETGPRPSTITVWND